MKIAMSVSGRVQGVGFRYMTKMVADELGVCGIVKNEDDGNVYIEAYGDDEKIEAFITAVKKSPAPFGRVDQVVFKDYSKVKDYPNFSVTY